MKPPKTPLVERIEVPGARPAAFKLVERAKQSFDLYRSSRKVGTARVEEDGAWSARFVDTGKTFVANAASGEALLKLVGTYLLAREARAAAAKPVEEQRLRSSGKKSPEELLSLKFLARAQASRGEDLDALIKSLGKRIRPAPKK